jgi:hypothetical protein
MLKYAPIQKTARISTLFKPMTCIKNFRPLYLVTALGSPKTDEQLLLLPLLSFFPPRLLELSRFIASG